MASPHPSPHHLFSLLFFLSLAVSSNSSSSSKSTIVFSTVGRSRYLFDIFAVPIWPFDPAAEHRLTDGVSVNFNGYFPSSTSLLYVSERDGVSNIYLTSHQSPTPFTFPLLHLPSSVKDRPSLSRDRLIYVSTHEPSPSPRQSWNAVYSTHLRTGRTTRLTPSDTADFSPSVSSSGDWTAVASSGDRGWSGEVDELRTSIYLFRTADGSSRTKLIDHGGWPCWADDTTLYFHRRSDDDGWWGVYRAQIDFADENSPVLISETRITPQGFHAFTPAASPGAPGIVAIATRRAGDEFRHIELLDLASNSYVQITKPLSALSHHYNPFISPDGSMLGYHRCRGGENGSPPLLLETIASPSPDTLSLFRIDGNYPSFSHDGALLAYVGHDFKHLFVTSSDGRGPAREVIEAGCFATAWDWRRPRVIYTSVGPAFATENTRVDIVSIDLGDGSERPVVRTLTSGGEGRNANNAFPSASPDGKWVVFRSGRSGHKNLYVMNAVEGEAGGVYRLTEGPWTDTMCNWSPDGEWIAFASDRDNPGNGSFAVYMVHPDGTGLRRALHSGNAGRTNHPWFSPDSKRVVFTSDLGGVSAEPVSVPHQFQPYGDIFTARIDGSDIRRLVHNAYEDGTPTWTPVFVEPRSVRGYVERRGMCDFKDCVWLAVNSTDDSNSAVAGIECGAA